MDGCTGISQTPTPSEGCNHRCLGTQKKHGVVMLAPTHLMLWFDGLFQHTGNEGISFIWGMCPANLEPRGYVLPPSLSFRKPFGFGKTNAKNPDRHWLIKPHSFPRPLLIKLQELIQKWKISGPATQHGYHPQITKVMFFCAVPGPHGLFDFSFQAHATW